MADAVAGQSSMSEARGSAGRAGEGSVGLDGRGRLCGACRTPKAGFAIVRAVAFCRVTPDASCVR